MSQRSRTWRRRTGSLRRWGCLSLRTPAGSGSAGSDSACWSSSWQNADESLCGAPGRRRCREGKTEEWKKKGHLVLRWSTEGRGLRIEKIFHLLPHMNFIQCVWVDIKVDIKTWNPPAQNVNPKLKSFLNPELNLWSLPQKYPFSYTQGDNWAIMQASLLQWSPASFK